MKAALIVFFAVRTPSSLASEILRTRTFPRPDSRRNLAFLVCEQLNCYSFGSVTGEFQSLVTCGADWGPVGTKNQRTGTKMREMENKRKRLKERLDD
jgi:hypothetical protein